MCIFLDVFARFYVDRVVRGRLADILCEEVLGEGTDFGCDLPSGDTVGESSGDCRKEQVFTIELKVLRKG